jgi:hypothetical protein
MSLKTYGFMNASMQEAWADKMSEVFQMANGADGVKAIEQAFDNLLSEIPNMTTEKQSEITALINATDWTNTESLLKLQLELQKEYGFSEEKAEGLT